MREVHPAEARPAPVQATGRPPGQKPKQDKALPEVDRVEQVRCTSAKL